MGQIRTKWNIIWTMFGLSAAGGAAFGFLYGPIVEVVLLVIRINEDTANYVPNASNFDSGALVAVMLISCVIGLVVGGFFGFIGGTIAGVVIAVVLTFMDKSPIETQPTFRVLSVVSALVGGLVTWVLMMGFDFQSNLAYMGADWITKGWFFYIVVPSILMGGVFWWISRVVIRRSMGMMEVAKV